MHYGAAWTRARLRESDALRRPRADFHLRGEPRRLSGGPHRPSAERKARSATHGATPAAILQSSVPCCAGWRAQEVFGVAVARCHQNPAPAHARSLASAPEWGSLPIRGGMEAAPSLPGRKIEAAPDRQQARRASNSAAENAPRRCAAPKRYDIEEIIDRGTSGRILAEFAELAARRAHAPGGSSSGPSLKSRSPSELASGKSQSRVATTGKTCHFPVNSCGRADQTENETCGWPANIARAAM